MNELFSLEDIANLRNIYKKDTITFIKTINKKLSLIKTGRDFKSFCILADSLLGELSDISPFISDVVNKIFCLMIKNHLYREVVKYISIIEKCVNYETLNLLKEMISNKKVEKFITTIDVYNVKKLIFNVFQKKKENDNVLIKAHLELEMPELEWIDII